ncbi:MAG: MotA/TolQ/ExbB proton channel family protein [Deltaproteobacteria bacterium]|nr:MotA/TolQ/ExbB proton channel family protein [Deltaproteobacteria bacterium]
MWQGVVPVATGGAAAAHAGLAASPAVGHAAAVAGPKAAAASQVLSPWELILNAGPVVSFVLYLLLAASVLCWAIIVAKAIALVMARLRSRGFLKAIVDAADDERGAELAMRAGTASPHARIWLAARRETELRPAEAKDQEGPTKRLERTLAKAVDVEVTRMEGWLGLLATVGSAAPFVGLFGTVWGIMTSFMDIGAQESATLAVVAPGIAEALIATAVGLIAAIPSVIAYNAFVRRIRVWNEDLAAYAAELVNQEDAKATVGSHES